MTHQKRSWSSVHEPINKSQRKKAWLLFEKRDMVNDEILCTLCNQPEYLDENSNEYKMTIGHLNIKKTRYEKYFNKNVEANLTPQHNICNQRLQGEAFYLKHESRLIQILEKNIAWSKRLQTVRQEKVIDLLSDDSSKIQDEKSRLYSGVCEKYLHTVLKDLSDEIPFSIAKRDISGICKRQYGFGNPASIPRHLETLCNRFNMLYVIEENNDRITVIRLMRKDEREKVKSILNDINPPKSDFKF